MDKQDLLAWAERPDNENPIYAAFAQVVRGQDDELLYLRGLVKDLKRDNDDLSAKLGVVHGENLLLQSERDCRSGKEECLLQEAQGFPCYAHMDAYYRQGVKDVLWWQEQSDKNEKEMIAERIECNELRAKLKAAEELRVAVKFGLERNCFDHIETALDKSEGRK